jgi:hypothetical protein
MGLKWSLREFALAKPTGCRLTLEAFEAAPPGEYRLRSSGEVVVNPDYITSWVVEAPPD